MQDTRTPTIVPEVSEMMEDTVLLILIAEYLYRYGNEED